MTTTEILTGLGLIGFGGLLNSGFNFLIATRKAKHDSMHSLKETRYKAIILLCYAFVYFERESTTLIINRPNITSIGLLKNELHVEFVNMALYGSDNVIFKMKKLIQNRNSQSLNELALAMRKDLYGIKTKLADDNFSIDIQ